MDKFLSEIKRIYSSLADDESRMIFETRLNYSLTGIHRYMRAVIETAECKVKGTPEWKRIHNKLEATSQSDGLYVYGCGMYGIELVEMATDISFKGFVDRKKISEVMNLPVISPDDLMRGYQGEYVVISSLVNQKAMLDKLLEIGVGKEKIIDGSALPLIIDSFQYFDLNELPLHDYEVFADVGAFDGMTTVNFMKWCRGNGESISFEPDERNISRLMTNMDDNGIENVTIILRGAWAESTKLRFASDCKCQAKFNIVR